MSKQEKDLIIDQVFEISNFQQRVKEFLAYFISDHQSRLLSEKIVGELMGTSLVSEDYVRAYEFWKKDE